MTPRSNRDFLGIVALTVLGPLCCLGIPLLFSAGVGATVWILGAAVPVAIGVVLLGVLIARWRRDWWRVTTRRLPTSPSTGPDRTS